jgi:hypothetical protein
LMEFDCIFFHKFLILGLLMSTTLLTVYTWPQVLGDLWSTKVEKNLTYK